MRTYCAARRPLDTPSVLIGFGCRTEGYSVIDQPESWLNFALCERNQGRRGMSPTKRVRKNQSSLGKEIPDGRFAQVIADALHREFGETHAAVKTVVGLTKANER